MVNRIEAGVETGAATLFAGAVGFCAWRALDLAAALPVHAALAAGLGAGAFVRCRCALKSFGNDQRHYRVPGFDLCAVEQLGPDELLLTDADRLPDGPAAAAEDDDVLLLEDVVARTAPDSAPKDDALLLDDVLADLGPDSRVVRLFDAASMPTPGQLKERIDRHLGGLHPAAPPDASQALYDALAELRLGLR
jgi:hypothetical protein